MISACLLALDAIHPALAYAAFAIVAVLTCLCSAGLGLWLGFILFGQRRPPE